MLGHAIQGGRRPSQSITWLRDEDTSETADLSGATITGTILRQGEFGSDALTGVFEVTDGPAGVFRWDYSAADVATAGVHRVQFNAAFPDSPTPERTMITRWKVEPSLS